MFQNDYWGARWNCSLFKGLVSSTTERYKSDCFFTIFNRKDRISDYAEIVRVVPGKTKREVDEWKICFVASDNPHYLENTEAFEDDVKSRGLRQEETAQKKEFAGNGVVF